MYQRARLGVGYLPQEASIFRGMTVEQNVMAVVELHERDRRAAQRGRRPPAGRTAHRPPAQPARATSLSGGERRRVEIARALASEPSFMLLDEPFAGIDPLAITDIKEVIGYLARRGIGVLITDHNVRETLDICDRASIIAGGEVLFEGTPGRGEGRPRSAPRLSRRPASANSRAPASRVNFPATPGGLSSPASFTPPGEPPDGARGTT